MEIPISQKTLEALKKVDRKDFIKSESDPYAYYDVPVSIGFEQTISQPSTVAFMLELLNLEEGMSVLDVGSGSGWTTALLAYIVGKKGKVIGVEIIPELAEFGRNNMTKYMDLSDVNILLAENELGYSARAPYDRILVSACSEDIPQELVGQLKIGGIMVIPVNNSLVKVTRRSKNLSDITTDDYPGFVFVPLKR
ncbi:MAG: protein-L-isoaspartate O-methyltransferase [Patescibacteria group bacterium]|jgi:protein-L-isoaspartate(D-aspartate) O-methyltransferase